MTLVIGLTGSIASGKSTVSLMFDDFDIPVIDADKVSREVVMPGEKAYNQIVDHFGAEILREDGSINRKRLGDIVFNDKNELHILNGIVHPEVRKKMIAKRNEYEAKNEKAVVLDIPLLFESNLTSLVDTTIVVYVSEQVQLERLMKRENFSETEARNRMNLQMPLEKKRSLADHVIDNNGTKHDSYEQLECLLRKWQLI